MALKIVEVTEPVTAGARVTGAAMDRPLPKRGPNYVILAIGTLLLLVGIAVLIEELSVDENVELAMEYASVPARERRERVAQMLDKLGVAHRAKHRPSQLSGGQQQRVAIARALVNKPAVLLADEPTGNLDTAHGEEVMRILQQINDEGTTIVMVTHSPAHAARASRTVGLLDGAIAEPAEAVAAS
jgi:ABC-type lipoprotein export system ATPase subunit